jgi:hypothetical protein
VTTRLLSSDAAVGRTEKYQIATPPPTSTIAVSSRNFRRSSWVRRASGNERSAVSVSSESDR